MLRRATALAAAIGLVWAAGARADYRAVSRVPADDEIALTGDEVLVGATMSDVLTLTAFPVAGGPGRELLRLEGPNHLAEEVEASRQAVAMMDFRSSWFGPIGGPLQRFPRDPWDIAVSGSTVLSVEPPWLVARDVAAGGVPRRVARVGKVVVLKVAGPYAAMIDDSHIVVREAATGREVYRVRDANLENYVLGADGRLATIDAVRGPAPIRTATPTDPHLRLVARLRLHSRALAVAGDDVAVVTGGRLGRVTLLRPDGTRRAVTPAMNRVEDIAYDGTTLAFRAGHCVFAGPLSPGPDLGDDCFDVPAEQRNLGTRRGRLVRVGARCVAPAVSHCTTVMRVFSSRRHVIARRVFVLSPGRHVLRLRIPKRKLWTVQRRWYVDLR
jgi:hypothetical protein